MSLAGAAIGAQQSLEEIVKERMLAQKLQLEIANRQEIAAREQQRIDETRRQNEWERQRADKLDAERATERTRIADTESMQRRGRSNMAGVVAMGLDPETTRREVAFSSLNADTDVPKGVMDVLTPEKPKKFQYTYTDPKTGKKSIRFADQDAVGLDGVDLGNEPQRPEKAEKPQIFNVGNGKLVDGTGRVIYDGGSNAQGVDATKAREKGASMLDAARSLRNHPGLSNLTGARIGNPDYALGVQNDPVAGSKAADAGAYFNQLKSLFTLDNIGLLKGVLSDSDMKILQQALARMDPRTD